MTSAHASLDELVVTPVALMPALPPGYGTQVQTSRSILTPSGRKLNLGGPFFARGISAIDLHVHWQIVCGLLRGRGLPLYATVEELQAVPAASVPARIARRFLGQPLIHGEVTTADAFELVNSTPTGTGWGWPFEITSGRDLKALVQTLRDATCGEMPIGMALPLNAKIGDLRTAIESSIDFLTLDHCCASRIAAAPHIAGLAAHSIVAAKKLCVQLGRPKLPIFLDAPITDCDHAIKLLALGAAAINISAMIREALPTEEPKRYESKLTENLLGSLASAPRVARELPKVELLLSTLLKKLSDTLQFTGLIDIAELESSCLRSLSPVVAEQLGVAPISAR